MASVPDRAHAEPTGTPAPEAPAAAPPVPAGIAPATPMAGLAQRPPEERGAVLGAMSRTCGNRAVTRMIQVSAPTLARAPGDERDRFPWIGEITGTWTAALRKTSRKDPADPHANTTADVPRGTQVLILGRAGGWLRARVTLGANTFEGYISHELVKFVRPEVAAPAEPPADVSGAGPSDPGPSAPPVPDKPPTEPPTGPDKKPPPEKKDPPWDVIDPPPPSTPEPKTLDTVLDHARHTLGLLKAAAAAAGVVATLTLALEEAAKARVTMEVLGVTRYLIFDPATGRLEFDLTNADYEARRRISRATMSDDLPRLERALQQVHKLEQQAAGELKASSTGTQPGPQFKSLSKAEYDKLTPAQQQEHLTQWMKAHNVERIIRSAKHHCWPEYLGGPAKQPLLSIDELKHIEFHSLLDTQLPRKLGSAFYAAKSPAEKVKDIATLRRVARDFDLEEGTKISQQLNAVLKGTPYENIPF
jgi:hypothetical protein